MLIYMMQITTVKHFPEPQDIATAQALIQQFKQKNVQVRFGDLSLELPDNLTDLFKEMLLQTAQGHGVAVVPLNNELSSQEAAEQLCVSRQWLINQAEAGQIAFRKVGSHRRFLLLDVLNFAASLERQSLEARQILADEAQRLGLDD
jgi:excisionase family DNA binding protein